MRLKLLTSSRQYALAGELVVFSWFFLEHQGTQSSFSELGGSRSSDIRSRGFFSGPIENSEFIFRTRRNSSFRYSEPAGELVVFSGRIGNSEFIFGTRRKSKFRYSFPWFFFPDQQGTQSSFSELGGTRGSLGARRPRFSSSEFG